MNDSFKSVAFFDVKPYDIQWFDKLKESYKLKITYFEPKLDLTTVQLTKGFDAVCVFVNDNLSADIIDKLSENGVKAVALRCAGFNNVDLKAANNKIKVYRVPAYSPNAVAEHAMALLLCLNRKIHRAYNRVREYNFSLKGLIGFDLKCKTMGVVGTGKIGQEFIKICQGFGMNILCYDPYPVEIENVKYVTLAELFKESDIISLHCPLTTENIHLINRHTLSLMKDGVYIINTSRGRLIDTEALLDAIKTERVAAAGLDVYEEEENFFFEDISTDTVHDDVLKLLLSTPNIIVTSHQAFLTEEALYNISEVTLGNLADFFEQRQNPNEVVFQG